MPRKKKSDKRTYKYNPYEIGREIECTQDESGDVQIEFDKRELVSLVCELFCKGLTVKKIIEALEEQLGEAGKMKRETPYALLRIAAKENWLRYHAPTDLKLAEKIRQSYMWLNHVGVVHTAVTDDVAHEASCMLIRLVQELCRNGKTEAIRIGFAAGFSMQKLAAAFADRLGEQTKDLPKKVIIHSCVAGFEPGRPTSDPNTFFSFFTNRLALQVEPEFVSLHAPSMVQSELIPALKENLEIRQAYEAAEHLDIIVTSGSDWADEHSSLRRCYERSPESLDALKKAGTVGDMLWRPIGKDGPIDIETAIRAMTLVELGRLPGFIREGQHVLLMLGSCGKCKTPKGKILHTILNQKEKLVSHLVVDSRTAGELVEIMKREEE